MQLLTKVAFRGLSVIIFLLFLSAMLNAQNNGVVIKEKVELNKLQNIPGPLVPILSFDGNYGSPYTIKHGEKVAITVILAVVIGKVQPTDVDYASATERLASVPTYGPITVSVDVSDGDTSSLHRGVFVTSSSDTIEPSNGKLEIHVSDGETFYYVANGNIPEDYQAIVVLHPCYPDSPVFGCNGYWQLIITWVNECVLVESASKKLSIGDTTLLSFVYGATNSPVPADKSLDVSIIGGTGGDNGTLLVDGNTGTSFTGVTQPIKYIAPKEISGDSLVVPIVASKSESTGGSGLAKSSHQKDSLKSTLSKNITMSSSILKVLQTQGAGGCEIGGAVVMGLNHFEVSIVPDTLAVADTVAFTEGAKLVIQPKDKDDNDVIIDASTLLKFSLLTNNEYGTFINSNGDTLKTTPVQLSNVRYGDAKAGKIKFAAINKNPQTMVACKIHVEKQDDPTKYAEKNVVVVEQTLKIVMEQPYQVRPSIPTENTDTTRVRQRKKSFEVKMTRGGKSVPNHPFRLSTNYVDSSGGHFHGDTRDTIRQNNNDNYGYFIVGLKTKRRPLDTLTNVNGKYATTYYASIFGDTMKICLKSKIKPLLLDSISVVEKVDSLENFKNVGSNNQWICRQSPTGSLRHPDEYNNWCMPKMKDSLKTAIGKFYEWSKEFFGTPIILSLNDMSLLYGGRFDMDARWDRDTTGNITQKRHYYHRNGKSVDINDQNNRKYMIKIDFLKVVNNKIKKCWKWTDTVGVKLKDIFDKYALKPEPEREIHFELEK